MNNSTAGGRAAVAASGLLVRVPRLAPLPGHRLRRAVDRNKPTVRQNCEFLAARAFAASDMSLLRIVMWDGETFRWLTVILRKGRIGHT